MFSTLGKWYPGFWCGKVFEGGQVTFLIKFENAILVRSIFTEISDHVSNCDFGAFLNDSNCVFGADSLV